METRTVTLTVQVETDARVETTVFRMVPVSFQMSHYHPAVQVGSKWVPAKAAYLVLHGEVFPPEEKAPALQNTPPVEGNTLEAFLLKILEAQKQGHDVHLGDDPLRRAIFFVDQTTGESDSLSITRIKGTITGALHLASAFAVTEDQLREWIRSPEGRAKLLNPQIR